MFRLFIESSSAHYAIIQKLFLYITKLSYKYITKVKRIRMQSKLRFRSRFVIQ